MRLAAALILSGAAGSLAVMTKAHACDAIRVSGANNWYPVIMRTEDDKSVHGLGPDVANAVFAALGIDVIVAKKRPWKRLMVQLDRGELDAILGAYWTSERSKRYLYSTSFAEDEIAIFVRRKSSFELTRLDDLIGRVGLRPLGGSYGEKFDRFAERYLDIEQIATTGDNNIVVMLASGRADYAVLGRYDGIADIKATNLQDEVTDLPFSVASNSVHFLFSRKSPCVARIGEVDNILLRLRKEGTLSQLEAKYLK